MLITPTVNNAISLLFYLPPWHNLLWNVDYYRCYKYSLPSSPRDVQLLWTQKKARIGTWTKVLGLTILHIFPHKSIYLVSQNIQTSLVLHSVLSVLNHPILPFVLIMRIDSQWRIFCHFRVLPTNSLISVMLAACFRKQASWSWLRTGKKTTHCKIVQQIKPPNKFLPLRTSCACAFGLRGCKTLTSARNYLHSGNI